MLGSPNCRLLYCIVLRARSRRWPLAYWSADGPQIDDDEATSRQGRSDVQGRSRRLGENR
jgi:hypothetical protein